MAKFKVTAKQVKNVYKNIIGVGYCSMQYLLYYKSPIAYNCGIYGWNFDVYSINDIAICTGYRNFPGVRIDYKILEEYENKARSIVDSYKLYNEKEKLVNSLLYEFINKVLNDNKK